jgi:hypothetical protein
LVADSHKMDIAPPPMVIAISDNPTSAISPRIGK